MNTMFDGNMATGHKPQASGWLVTCSLRLAAFLFFITIGLSAKAQASFPPININLNFPQYQRLKLDGGYVYVDDGGMSGIILYRESETNYIAYERRCSVDDDTPVTVDGSGLFMNGCGSTFGFSDGYPTSGPARQPLLKYRTSLSGTTLTITDEVVY